MNNFEKLFLQANENERAMGFHWYLDAHNYLNSMADYFDKPLDIVCGITAVLSPMIPWNIDVNLTYNILKNKGKRPTVTGGAFSQNIAKALKIYKTKRVFPSLNGPKVTEFYRNLLDPWCPDCVTIDTFMISVALNCQPKDYAVKLHSTEKFIEVYKQEIKALAVKYMLLPLQVQAIIWIVQHRVLKSMASYSGQMKLNIF